MSCCIKYRDIAVQYESSSYDEKYNFLILLVVLYYLKYFTSCCINYHDIGCAMMKNTPNRQYNNSTMKIIHHLVTSVLLQIFLIHIALHVMIFKSEQSYSLTKRLHYFISVSISHK